MTRSNSLGHIYKSNVGGFGRLGPYAVDGCFDTTRTIRLGFVAFDLPSLARHAGI